MAVETPQIAAVPDCVSRKRNLEYFFTSFEVRREDFAALTKTGQDWLARCCLQQIAV